VLFILYLPQVATLTKLFCVWHVLPRTEHCLKLRVATSKPGQNFPQLDTLDVTQVSFAFVRHTLEAQVSYLHVGPNLAVGKKLFNESQSHIILHPFYIQHCVGKTWRGWGPNLLVDRAFRRRSTTNYLH